MVSQSNSPTVTDLLTEIQTVLAAPSMSSVMSASAIWDLYEAYIFSLVVKAAQQQEGRVTLATATLVPGVSRPAKELLFRRGPGSLRNPGAPYTFATIQFDNKSALEAHVGIYVAGRSGIPHECDIVVIPASASARAQQNNEEPKHSNVVIAAECKFYSSPLGLDLARSFIGLTVDASAAERWTFVTNTSSDRVKQVLTGNKRKWEDNVVPANANNVNLLVTRFQQAFKDYRSSR